MPCPDLAGCDTSTFRRFFASAAMIVSSVARSRCLEEPIERISGRRLDGYVLPDERVKRRPANNQGGSLVETQTQVAAKNPVSSIVGGDLADEGLSCSTQAPTGASLSTHSAVAEPFGSRIQSAIFLCRASAHPKRRQSFGSSDERRGHRRPAFRQLAVVFAGSWIESCSCPSSTKRSTSEASYVFR